SAASQRSQFAPEHVKANKPGDWPESSNKRDCGHPNMKLFPGQWKHGRPRPERQDDAVSGNPSATSMAPALCMRASAQSQEAPAQAEWLTAQLVGPLARIVGLCLLRPTPANSISQQVENANRKASMYQLHYFPANANAAPHMLL